VLLFVIGSVGVTPNAGFCLNTKWGRRKILAPLELLEKCLRCSACPTRHRKAARAVNAVDDIADARRSIMNGNETTARADRLDIAQRIVVARPAEKNDKKYRLNATERVHHFASYLTEKLLRQEGVFMSGRATKFGGRRDAQKFAEVFPCETAGPCSARIESPDRIVWSGAAVYHGYWEAEVTTKGFSSAFRRRRQRGGGLAAHQASTRRCCGSGLRSTPIQKVRGSFSANSGVQLFQDWHFLR